MPVPHHLVVQVGGLSKSRPADDPLLLAKKAELQQETLIAAIERALQKAPKMTDVTRQKIIGMLS
jgi:hypothetical protein